MKAEVVKVEQPCKPSLHPGDFQAATEWGNRSIIEL
jgi:hypothetical protein